LETGKSAGNVEADLYFSVYAASAENAGSAENSDSSGTKLSDRN
jgi:hypothetical protein